MFPGTVCIVLTTQCVWMQLLRSHSWQWVQEVLGEDASTHVALRGLEHPAKTDHRRRKAQQRQDCAFLCHKNSRYVSARIPGVISEFVIDMYWVSEWLVFSLNSKGTFVFTGNTSTTTTPGTQKSAFDLKASLARPLTYKPHAGRKHFNFSFTEIFNVSRQTMMIHIYFFKGKLKPFGEAKENTAGNKSLISANSHQKNYKQPKVQTRYV